MKKISLFILPSILILILLLTAQNPYRKQYNLQVEGWLFGRDASFAGERTWGKDGTADTLAVAGVDTTCIVVLTAKTATGTLRYDITSKGDTVFVTSSASETGSTDKYSYIIIRNGYNASD